ncbi:hypothetical protein [uncultured Flavobacterium sp.]|uniref:hypothetical protein n=1 Tax=uncultured Flavobacterium sp. TaxID=165435 RepID=UPI0030C84C5F
MARIISYEGKRLPNIKGYVIYPLNNSLIIRTVSGFTKEGLQKNPKYDLCRKNATEFGAVSKMGKLLRMSLSDVLPRKNRLAIVNAFTKKMHSLLAFDTVHEKGKRTIATALTTEGGKAALKGYDFNPASAFVVNYTIEDKHFILQVHNTCAHAIKWIGLRLLVLDIDLATTEGFLHVGTWQFENPKTLALSYPMPEVLEPVGTLFYLLELEAFTLNDATYMPLNEPKGLVFLDIVHK